MRGVYAALTRMIAADKRMYAAHTRMITTPAQDIDTPLLWNKSQINALCSISICANKKTNTILTIFIRYLLTIANTCRVLTFTYVKRCSILLANRYHRWMYSFSKICFFYMEHIIFLGIIANRWISLLSRLYRFYDTHAISNLTNETGHLDTYDFNCMDI